jgi:hypothetical protein
VKYFSSTTNLCIIRVGREHVRTAWGAVTLLGVIEGQKVLPNVAHVSGTNLANISATNSKLSYRDHQASTIGSYSTQSRNGGQVYGECSSAWSVVAAWVNSQVLTPAVVIGLRIDNYDKFLDDSSHEIRALQD